MKAPQRLDVDVATTPVVDGDGELGGGLPWYRTTEGRQATCHLRFGGERRLRYKDTDEVGALYGRWSVARTLGSTRSIRSCGMTPLTNEDGESQAELVSGRGIRNVQTCGNPWSCPHCSVMVARDRQRRAAGWAEGAAEEGAAARLVLLTLSHKRGDSLGELLDRLLGAWRDVFGGQGATGRWLRRQGGMVAAVRGVEVTHGANGWHPHIHAVVWFESQHDADRCERRVRDAWELAIGHQLAPNGWGWEVPRDHLAAAEYATKGGATGRTYALEVAKGQRHGGDTSVWSILDRIGRSGSPSARDLALWSEYTTATKGRRALGTINRKWLESVHVEQTEESDDDDNQSVAISATWIRFLVRHRLVAVAVVNLDRFRVVAEAMAEWHSPAALEGDTGLTEAELADVVRGRLKPPW